MTSARSAALFLLAAATRAFRLPATPTWPPWPPSRTAGRGMHPPPPTGGATSSAPASATALGGKLWKRLDIPEDDPDDGASWYLVNCVAGQEIELLNQCRHVCAAFNDTVVEKFVVPTERHLRSHGDKRKLVDVKVRYPGYVFCKICLVEDVYETIQQLPLTRSWMGATPRAGYKKLPPEPLPLGEEELHKFRGLEEAQDAFEETYQGDYSGRGDKGDDLLSQYEGYDVGQMVKVLGGNYEGEDGTVKRLKDGQLMVRLFTYGQVSHFYLRHTFEFDVPK